MRRDLMLSVLLLAACNAAPEGGSVTIEPGFPDTRSDLVATASGATDPDGDALSWTYQWLRDGEVVEGLTTDTVPASETARDQVWTVRASPTDGALLGPAATAEVTILNAPPTVTVEITPEQPGGDDDLVAQKTATDADDDIVDITWIWTVDGVEQTDLTTDTVPSSRTRRGQTWAVTAQPEDRFGVGPSGSDTVEIFNARPVIVDAQVSPVDPFTTSVLVATAGASDEEGDRVVLSYDWFIDGSDLGVSGSTLAPDYTQKGDSVSVRIVANDGFDDSDPVEVGPVVVRNSPPVAPEIEIAGGLEDEPLVCSLVTPASDADASDTLTYDIVWTVDGATYGGSTDTTDLTGDTIPADVPAQGEEWTCTVTVSDGEAEAEPVSATATIGGGNVTFRAGYYWVIADYPATSSDHASVCSSAGLRATARDVTLRWDATLLSQLATDFGYTSVGDVNNSATCMWCYEVGSSYPAGNSALTCETHNFGSSYTNYGRWGTYSNQRPVFTCVK